MNKEKKVSIIIPVYKVEKYLVRCLNSIISQTYGNLEIILIDDGSPDNCPKICDDFMKKDERIAVIHQNNQGPSSARNNGLKICTGEYIAFFDSDDFINVNVIKRWVELLESTEADLVVGNIEKFYGTKDPDEIIKSRPDGKKYFVKRSEDLLKEMFLSNCDLCVAWGKLYRKELLAGIYFREDVSFGEDMFVSHILFDRSNNIIVDQFTGVYYSQEGTSAVRSSFNIKKLDMLYAADEWLEFVKNKYPNLIEAAFYRNIVITCNIFGDVVCWNNSKAESMLNMLSNRVTNNWKLIKTNRYFSFKDIFKAYIVKMNWIKTMKVYKTVRLKISQLQRRLQRIKV